MRGAPGKPRAAEKPAREGERAPARCPPPVSPSTIYQFEDTASERAATGFEALAHAAKKKQGYIGGR